METDLRQEIELEALSGQIFETEAFANIMSRRLQDAEQVFDLTIELLNCTGPRNRRLELMGYAEDPTDESLILLVGKYFGTDETLTMSDAKEVLKRGMGFFEFSANGWLVENLEPASKEMNYAEHFSERYSKKAYSRIRMLLITDGRMSERIKTVPSDIVSDLKVTFEIWDSERILEAARPERGSEDILVDFTQWLPGGLPCLVAEQDETQSQILLAVLPGNVLRDVFDEFGSLLLESNVRTFLSARGAVNRGIQATLAQEPSKFLAYNNGLTTTGTDVQWKNSPDGPRIQSIRKWQIVNGGQTTASLAHFARLNKGANLHNVSVQMKVVQVNDEDSAPMVQAVAKYANSQNRVSGADLFATHEVHIRLEQISRRVKAPPKEGEQYQSGWYYERARGQWENDRAARRSVADQKKFELEFPKYQKMVKTDWATFAYCWSQKPHLVSKGAQSVFADYADAVDKQWERDDSVFNEEYFKTNVGKAILYKNLKTAVMRAEWYRASPGYLANIVAYAIAKFAQSLEIHFPGRKFDFGKIWNLQTLPDDLLETLLEFARVAREYLTNENRPQANVTQWAKQVLCWDRFKEIPVRSSQNMEPFLLTQEEAMATEKDARQTQQMDNGFAEVQFVLSIPRDIWGTIHESAATVNISPTEKALVDKFGLPEAKQVPSERQAAVMMRLLERMARDGIIPPLTK